MEKPSTKSSRNNEELILFVEQLKKEWVATIDALMDPLAIISPEYKDTKS